jgi:3-dehydroquinate synthetase
MNKVFVIHQPAVRDYHTGEMRPQFDLSPALRYGEVIDVLPPGSVTQDYNKMAKEVHKRLTEEGYSKGDYILALGDPVAIVVGAFVAASLTPHPPAIRLLKWDRRMRGYVVCNIPAILAFL